MGINIRKIYKLLAVFITIEILSLFAYFCPMAGKMLFLLIFLAVILVSLKNLKYGILIMLAELLIGGKGYLFYFEKDGLLVSIRMAIWLSIMAVWIVKELRAYLAKKDDLKSVFKTYSSSILPYFMLLMGFSVWGVINGLLNNNGFANIFFDANSWLYLFLIFPVYRAFLKDRNGIKILGPIFLSAVVWLSVKTLILEYFFSHKIPSLFRPIYNWVRDTGVGEVTLMESGFTRIFFQSHIFILFSFFILLFFLNKFLLDKDIFIFKKNSSQASFFLISLTLAISTILISLSRSFWVGSLLTFLLYLIYTLKNKGWRKTFKAVAIIILTTILSFVLIIVLIKFPYPKPGNISLADTLSKRATALSGEAAASSRYQLWPKLITKIKDAPVLGKGFGTSVTYKSGDSRILDTTADGMYTTYAFEWGWLDIWLKLGIFGLLAYLFLIYKLIKISWSGDWFSKSLAASILLLAIVNFLTPYANHPLGIGFLIISAIIIESNNHKSKKYLP